MSALQKHFINSPALPRLSFEPFVFNFNNDIMAAQ